MRWLLQLLGWRMQEDRMIASVPYGPDPVADAAQRDYEREKLAALDAEIERLARLRRLGYDFDVAVGQDSDHADH